jgi:hypothetical protein
VILKAPGLMFLPWHRFYEELPESPVPLARALLPDLLLSLCAHGNVRLPLQTPGQRPGGLKAISYRSVTVRKSVVPVDTEAVSTEGSLLFKCGLSMMGFRTAR